MLETRRNGCPIRGEKENKDSVIQQNSNKIQRTFGMSVMKVSLTKIIQVCRQQNAHLYVFSPLNINYNFLIL